MHLTSTDAVSGVDETYYSLDGSDPSIPATEGTVVSSEGTTTLKYYSVDAAGNAEGVTTKTVRIDRDAPVTTDDAPSTWATGTVTVHLTSTDAVSGVDETYYSLDGSDPSIPATEGTVVSSEGTTTLKYYSVDAAGNAEGVTTKTVRIDRDAPVSTDDAPSTWATGTVTVHLTSTDAVSGVDETYYSLDGSDPSIPATEGTVVSSEGTTTLKYYSVDAAGNAEGVTTKTVRIDRDAPVTTSDSQASYLSTATITLFPTDARSGVRSTHWRLDGGQWTTGTVASTGATGTHLLEWYSVDVAGTRESTRSATFALPSRFDSADPQLFYQGVWSTSTNGLLYGNTDRWTDTTGTVHVAFDGTGVSLIGTKYRTYGIATVSIDGSVTVPVDLYASNVSYQQRLFSVMGLPDGRHVLRFSWTGSKNASATGTAVRLDAIDVLGALTAADTAAPVTTTNVSDQWRNASVTATLSATDDFSGVRASYYRLNGGATTTYTAGIAVTTEGTHTIQYWSSDNYGNVEATKTASVRVDKTAPSTSDNTPPTWQRTPFSVSLVASDALSGPSTTRYTLNSSSTAAEYSGPISIATDGVTTIKYSTTDKAGNKEATKTVLARLDQAAPTSLDDAPASWARGPVTVRITSTDPLSGVARSFASTDGTAPSFETSRPVISAEGTSTLKYYAVDSAGNTESVTTKTVLVDNTVPTIASDVTSSYAGTASISFTASDTLSGVSAISYRVDGGAWVNSSTLTTSAPGTHVLQYYATDGAGNSSLVATASFDVSKRYEQGDGYLWYSGTWSNTSNDRLSNTSDKWTQTASSTVTAAFDGTGITWISAKYKSYGMAAVSIDGGAPQSVDLYNKTALYQQNVFTVNGLANGRHTIKITYTGEQNPAAIGTVIRLDAFDVIGTLVFVGQRTEQTDSKLLYEGVWGSTDNAGLSGGSDARTDSAGSALTVAFNGTGVSWIGTKSPYYGQASVSIDGSSSVLVDMYAGTTAYQQSLFSIGNLPKGPHTMRIEWLGTKNPAASGTVVRVDAVEVQGALEQAVTAGDPTTRSEQTDAHLRYSGTWSATPNSSLSGGSDSRTDTAGGAVEVRFDGTGIAWVGTKAPQYGKAIVTLDGGAPVTVDTYGASVAYKQRLWAVWGLTPGPHTVRIEWTGTKNAASTGTVIRLDAFDVAGTLLDLGPAHEPGTRFEQTDQRLTYSGTWPTTANALLSGGSDTRIDATGSVDATFTGTGIVWVGTRAPYYGEAWVTVDGAAPQRVDLYAAGVKYQDEILVVQNLASGTHTLRIEWAGTKNGASSGTVIRLDALDVIGGSLE